jgi:molybdate transport system substrate-binding protein
MLVLAIWPRTAQAEDVTVFAASSLRTAMEAIGDGFEAETGHRLTLAHGGSSALARQITLGAPADVFISANTDWMDWLDGQGALERGTRFDLAGNQLILIGHGAAGPTWPELSRDVLIDALGDRPLAMALVDAVPAGLYGRSALQSLGFWEAVSSRIVQVDNVRAALALVALGEAPLGIVYQSDARAAPAVSVLYTFPEATHAPIRYPVAILAGRSDPASRAFLDYLRGPVARAALERNGFLVDEP